MIPYILSMVNPSKSVLQSRSMLFDGQRGCPNRIPGLTASPFWDTNNFEWIKALESKHDEIKKEFMSLRSPRKQNGIEQKSSSSGFQHYRSPNTNKSATRNGAVCKADELGSFATDSGEWNVFYFHLHGLDFADNLSRCPITAEAIK